MVHPSQTNRAHPTAAIAGGLRLTSHLARGVLDTLLPPRCLGCETAIGAARGLCPDCWSALAFITPPVCGRCGVPFPYGSHDEGGDGALCAACVAEPPVFGAARAALRYDDGSRGLLLGFKHADRLAATALFAQWLALAGRTLLQHADLLAPVPLHPWRLARRRYNQAALLAQAVARLSDRPAVPDLLRRIRHTPSQGGAAGPGGRATSGAPSGCDSGMPGGSTGAGWC